MEKVIINPKSICEPMGPYSQSVRISGADLIFLAGQVGVDSEGKIVGKGDMKAQTRQALENIKLILEAHNTTLDAIVRIVIYTIDVDGFLGMDPHPLDEYFKKDFPTSVLIEVKRLAEKDMMVEIEAIAAV